MGKGRWGEGEMGGLGDKETEGLRDEKTENFEREALNPSLRGGTTKQERKALNP